jgi:hypothetical protein
MKNLVIAVILLVVAAAAYAGWQIGSVYLADAELQEDLKDLSSLTGTRIGLVDSRSPGQIRDQVIEHAAGHGIHLEPDQVTVERTGEGIQGSIYLSTAYDAPVNLFGFTWNMHFTTSGPRP